MKPDATKPAAPPLIASRQSWPVPLILALTLLGLAGLGVLFLLDPAQHALYPVCLFKKTTGYDCPGCGGLRAVHQLLRGEVWQAFKLNAMVVIALPLLVIWAIWAWINPRRGKQPRKSRTGLIAGWLVTVIVLFGILRNLPIWPFGVTPM